MAALSRADHLRPAVEVSMQRSLVAPLTRAALVGVVAALAIAPPFVARSAQPQLVDVRPSPGLSALIGRPPVMADARSASRPSDEKPGCRSSRERLCTERDGWIIRRSPCA